MLRNLHIKSLAAVLMALLAVGCLPAVHFKRQTLIPPRRPLPVAMQTIHILPFAVKGPEYYTEQVPSSPFEDKIEEHLNACGYQVENLRHLQDMRNYEDILKAFVDHGEIGDELKETIRRRGEVPDALLSGKLTVKSGSAPWYTFFPKLFGWRDSSDRIEIWGNFRLAAFRGKESIKFNPEPETQPVGRIHDVVERFAREVSEELLPRWEEDKWSAFYNDPVTEGAARRLASYGAPETPGRDNLLRVEQDLETHLEAHPQDDSALFLRGLVHELVAQPLSVESERADLCLEEIEKAKKYYDAAIALRPDFKGYSEALRRVAGLEAWVRDRAEGVTEQERPREQLPKEEEQGKDYEDLLKKD